MSITQHEFNQQCIKFISKCRDLKEHWYIATENSGQVDEIAIESINLDNLDDLRLMLMKSDFEVVPPDQVRTYEYNVIYSESYEVPVMYFSRSHQDGSLLNWENVSSNSPYSCEEDLGQVISQVEHPLLFRPFHMIHPCRTKDFMGSHNKVNYLVCWLSTIGTLIGLKLDFRLAGVNDGNVFI